MLYDEIALLLEHPRHRAGLAQIPAVLGEEVTQIGDRPITIVGHRFDQNRHATRPVAFVDYFLEVVAFQLARSLLDGSLDVVLWHVERLGLVHREPEPRIESDEWEYVAQASADKANGRGDSEQQKLILDWYAKPASEALANVQQTPVNYWGVYGMHGAVWEWVNDFSNVLSTGESRGDSQLEQDLFCGAGAASSVDPSDYAAFMRYAFRSSLQANYTLVSLGFRCARNADE